MGSKAKPPAAPDYTALAKQTADSANAAAQATTVANRPNQYNAFGSSEWKQDPTSGQWTQTQSLNAADQQRLDSQRQLQQGQVNTAQGLLGQVQNTVGQPLDTSGMQAYNPNKLDPGFGAVQQVRDDYLKLVQPDMDLQRSNMEAQLRQRGLDPYNTEAGRNAYRMLSDAEARRGWEATGKATDAYNDIFQRGLAGNTQANQTRGAQMQEAMALRQLPMQEMLNLQNAGNQVVSPNMPSFMSATEQQGTDYSGAASQQYQAAMNEYNAKKASSPVGGLLSLAGTLGGAALGNPALGSMLGGAVGGLFGGGGGGSSLTTPYTGSGYGYKVPW